MLELSLNVRGNSSLPSDIAFDAFSQHSAAVGGNFSFTHTPVGTPAGVYVIVTDGFDDTDRVTSVTYGGVTMSENPSSPFNDAAGESGTVHLYYLHESIPTGPQTVQVNETGGGASHAACITITKSGTPVFQDVQTLPYVLASLTSRTLNLGGSTCFCFLGFVSDDNAPTGTAPLANWTERGEMDLGSRTAGYYTYDIVAGTNVVAGWTQSTTNASGICVAVR
jgi:hypothetical protein